MSQPDFILTESISSPEILLHRMTNRIRQSLELPDILASTVTEVRAFLKTDRVKVYRFHPDGSGEVIAEAIHEKRLPSLIGHRFPAGDIPPEARELFLKARQRTIVNVAASQIGTSPLRCPKTGTLSATDIQFRPVDPCHAEYLTAMGVQSSLVVPILSANQLWGLLVSHHHAPRRVAKRELKVVQSVADQVSVAIAHSTLLSQTRLQAQQEATINYVVSLLHSTTEMQFQAALEQTVAALQGIGGRIYITPQSPSQTPQLFTYGTQPNPPSTSPPPSSFIEQHPDWQACLNGDPVNSVDDIWAISDLYDLIVSPDITLALLSAQIRGLLVVRLQYRQQFLGYLSVFRGQIEIETIWAGRLDNDDPRQLRPRQSFETWRELRQGQSHDWTSADVELARNLGNHLAMAIHQYELYRQVQALNTELEHRVLERTTELQQANAELRREIAERERALRERQQARDSLKRLSRQNELILNSAGEGIYGLNLQGKTTFVNPAAARILGYEVEELSGQCMYTLLNHSKPDGTPYDWEENPIHQTLIEGAVQHITEDLFYRQDGSSFPVEYVSTPIREQGRILGAVVIFKDITERQIVERMKDEFVSVVSHELRTPLTSIRAALGLLARGDLTMQPDKSQRMLDIAFSNTNRLVRLVNDILDIERIKFGKVTLKKHSCNAADLITEAIEVMRAMAERSSIKLVANPVSVELWADPDRIIQTLTNLLSNAIKFSPQGSTVWVVAELKQKILNPKQQTAPTIHSSPDTLLIAVKDQGLGIPEDKLETIFGQFQQLDASNSGHQGGTGLGLAICRSIVQQHGGQIWAESRLGKGSNFYFTLPLPKDNYHDHQTHLDH
ncbi:ATP-binding protein [Thermocoleostomius sinensis]|uniref:histidine kinase n=1 Tax=Thermocoleostomius sinensis A174 TaxID=2016057 RepID=A0A9E8ZDC5_9CYAN|nr:ATP-binding protein [Thermocoleostomius sinensis]WAL59772.1 ATP-binding protein [Thermocoleostomius sinensis A174]